ncbi:hypothetical protein Tco_1048082 [Tanacetum coccineum]
MHPLAPHYERKTRADRGKKRPRESNASSCSSTLNHPSSSHPLDDSIDENDDESLHSNPSSPSQKISSSSNNVSRVHQNPPHKMDVVFDGAFGGVGDEEVIVGEGVVVTSSSQDMLTNSCLGGIMVSLIFLEGLDEEALVEFLVEWCEEDEDDDRSREDDLFN